MRKKHGFTLAEVLITLSIIGIVAAMTVPNLTQSWKKQARLSQLKTAYSILSNATNIAIAENGSWDLEYIDELFDENGLIRTQHTTLSFVEKYFFPYVKTNGKGAFRGTIEKGKSVQSANYYPIYYRNGEIDDEVNRLKYAYSVTLDNGMIVHIYTFAGLGTYYTVDLNGLKGPNMYGNDVFVFIVKFGNINRLVPASVDETDCTANSSDNATDHCCAGKIIKNSWKFPDDYPIKKF